MSESNKEKIDVAGLLPLVLEACERAREAILVVYNSDDFEAERKDDNSPLTLADRKSHEVIDSYLMKTGIPIISEEGKEVSYEERKEWPYFWLVDPLDGTKEFLKRNGEFTVNVALIKGHEPVLGVVNVPVTGETFYAIAGEGAHLKVSGTTTRLSNRTPADVKQKNLRVVASRSHMNPETEAYVSKLVEPTLIAAGSSLKFMSLAKGDADLYPRYIPSMEWDIAAADVIVREVGLKTIDVSTGAPLLYNKKSLLNGYFVCGAAV